MTIYVVKYTVKKYPYIHGHLVATIFPYFTGIKCGPRLYYSVDLWTQTFMEPVLSKYGKLATNYPWGEYTDIFTALLVSIPHTHVTSAVVAVGSVCLQLLYPAAEHDGEPAVQRVQAGLVLAVVDARRRLSAVHVHGTQRRLQRHHLRRRHSTGTRPLVPTTGAEAGRRVRAGQPPPRQRQRTTTHGGGRRSRRPIRLLERPGAG